MRSAGNVNGNTFGNELPRLRDEPPRPSCTLDGCMRPLYCKGMCRSCYQKAWAAAKKSPKHETSAPDPRALVHQRKVKQNDRSQVYL